MAFTANAVGRVRVGGNNANGTFYDASVAGSGTDYTDQDAAQASWTSSLSMVGTTTLTDSGGNNLFTAAMTRNAVKVGNLFYFCVAYIDANNMTVDRADTFTNQSGKLGGAAADPWTILDSATATHGKAVEGNTIYLRGDGSNDPTTVAYDHTGYFVPVNGDSSSGRISIVGENGRPHVRNDGLCFFGGNHLGFIGISFTVSGTNFGTSHGLLHLTDQCLIRNCKFDMANYTCVAFMVAANCTIMDNQISGHSSKPTASSSCYGIRVRSWGNTIKGNTIKNCKDVGLWLDYSGSVEANLIVSNAGDGVFQGGNNPGGTISGNTIDGNDGHGLVVDNAQTAERTTVLNNLFTNHVGSGKAGLYFNFGSATVNDKKSQPVDYNRFYNNTAHRTNISAGANDVTLSADPYTDASTLDYSLNSTAGGGADVKGVRFPTSFPGSNTASSGDIGASQAAAGGSAPAPILIHKRRYVK